LVKSRQNALCFNQLEYRIVTPGWAVGGAALTTGPLATPGRPIERTEPQVVPPHLLSGRRIGGDDRIAAPDAVRLAMVRADEAQLLASIKMCLARDGRVRDLTVLRSSGYPEYDAELLRQMRRWRYEPYQVSGEPVPVCTAVTFIYRLRR
jgi:TonB family protein